MAVTISTGDTKRNYEIIDVVFAMDSFSPGMFSSDDPNKAFQGVRKQLVSKCVSLKGDAVIHCHFDYRPSQGDGVMSKKQVFELFAYGTVVKFVSEN